MEQKIIPGVSAPAAVPAPVGPGRLALLALVFLLGLVLRVDAWRLTELETPRVRADAAEYYFCTVNLRHYGVYTRHDSRREGPPTQADYRRWPGLSLLALPFAGDPDRLVPRFLLAQTLASAAAGLLVYWLAAAIAGFGAGLVALFLYAIAPHLINANLYFLTESPTAMLVLCFASALLCALRTGRTAWWCAAGAMLGLATLTRPFLELAAPLMLGALWIGRHPQRSRALLALGGAFLVAVLPWHLMVSLSEVPAEPGLMVHSIQHGMYPDFMYAGRPETFGLPYHHDPATPRIAGNLGAVLGELAQRAGAQPLVYAHWYLVGKPLMLWQWAEVQGVREIFIYPPLSTPFDYLPQFRAALWTSRLLHYPGLLLCLATLVVACTPAGARSMRPELAWFLRLMAVLFLWTTLLHMIGAPLPRYHMPLKPLVFVLAAAGGVLLLRSRFGSVAPAAP